MRPINFLPSVLRICVHDLSLQRYHSQSVLLDCQAKTRLRWTNIKSFMIIFVLEEEKPLLTIVKRAVLAAEAVVVEAGMPVARVAFLGGPEHLAL
jgi:hypothetical protein